jgi:4-amino-4-deoxy-L-arabinose transferase-like glycosyltransferase
MTRTAKLLLVPLFVLQLLFFGFVAWHRFVDGDEGFYLLASRLVLMHKKPYLDFLYMQAPLLPYVYALWMKCFGISWNSARLFSALLTTLLGTLLYEHVCRLTRNWLAGLAAVVLFASSALVFAWFSVVKTFSLAGLFLFCAYSLVSRLSAESSPWLIAVGGLLLGLSVDTRSYLLLLIPTFLWWIFHNCDARARLASILWFLGGFAIAMVPCLYLFISSPDAFLFNNLGYHAIRTNAGLVGMWQEKLAIVLILFLGGTRGI